MDKRDSEIHLDRKMSDILRVNYYTFIIKETHKLRISYQSQTISREECRELSVFTS